ncbi:hypothetical protein AVEN_275661-1, partial [Araneus ventricosus]
NFFYPKRWVQWSPSLHFFAKNRCLDLPSVTVGPCDDLPAKQELLHWGTMRRARRDLVTRLCRASVNSAIKEHEVMCRLTATAFDENDPSVRTLSNYGFVSLPTFESFKQQQQEEVSS